MLYTTLLGAHGGAHGVIVALGTGSVAAAFDGDGECRVASGFGYPSGDEASGAWLGLRAIVHAQQALDGRAPNDDLAQALLAHTGAHDRDSLVVWLCEANQTAYARLAPIVVAHRTHPFAARLLGEAGVEVGKMIAALDPSATLAGRAVRRARRTVARVRAADLSGAFARTAGRLGARWFAIGAARSGSHRRLRIGCRAGRNLADASRNGKIRSLTLPGCSHYVQSHCY